MKNIFIGGVAKSGKSTLALELTKDGKYNHIPVDYFASSFKHNFSEVGITSNVVIDKESSKKLALFLSRFIEIASLKDELFILDSAHILPQDIVPYIDLEKWDVYYLGYPNMSPEEKLKEVRTHIKGGWVAKKSDEELLVIFDKLINISKEMQDYCLANNIEFIDTSNKYIKDIKRNKKNS